MEVNQRETAIVLRGSDSLLGTDAASERDRMRASFR